MWKHLQKVRQSYCEHLCDALVYAGMAFQAGFIFIAHGFYPDLWEYDGGMMIQKISIKIENKRRKIMGN